MEENSGLLLFSIAVGKDHTQGIMGNPEKDEKNPRVTAKYLQKTRQTVKVFVHVSTPRKTLNNHSVNQRTP